MAGMRRLLAPLTRSSQYSDGMLFRVRMVRAWPASIPASSANSAGDGHALMMSRNVSMAIQYVTPRYDVNTRCIAK